MKKIMLLLFIFSIACSNIFAATNIYRPKREFYINDYADIITSNVEKSIYTRAAAIEKKTTVQVVVVTVPDLDGEDIGKYAAKLYSEWGIGNNKDSSGVLILISKAQRKIKIEVGYGLSGVLNSSKINRLLEGSAKDALKKNDYNTAVKNLVYEIQGIVYNKYGIEGGFDNYASETYNIKTEIIVAVGIGAVILCTPFIYNFIKKRKRRYYY